MSKYLYFHGFLLDGFSGCTALEAADFCFVPLGVINVCYLFFAFRFFLLNVFNRGLKGSRYHYEAFMTVTTPESKGAL